MTLWLAGGVMLLRRTRKAFAVAPPAHEGVHQDASLGLIALALAMTTDNPIVYVFFVTPLAVMVGLSLGTNARDGAPGRVR
jgi:O-antigen ligase